MRAKNTDYTGGSDDPFANFRISEVFGVHPVVGILMRISDKMQRIRAFIANGKMAVATESVDDACEDIINYAILIKGMFHEAAENPALACCIAASSNTATCTNCGSTERVENYVYGPECAQCENHTFTYND